MAWNTHRARPVAALQMCRRAAVPARLSPHRLQIASFATSCTSAMFGRSLPAYRCDFVPFRIRLPPPFRQSAVWLHSLALRPVFYRLPRTAQLFMTRCPSLWQGGSRTHRAIYRHYLSPGQFSAFSPSANQVPECAFSYHSQNLILGVAPIRSMLHTVRRPEAYTLAGQHLAVSANPFPRE